MTTMISEPGETLENGMTLGDNLLIDYAATAAAGYGALAVAAGGRAEHDADLGVHLADSESPMPLANTAHLLAPMRDGAAPAAVEAMRAFFSARPGGPFMVFSPWPTTDLRPHGFHLVGHPPFMVRPAASSAPVVPGLHIVEATTPETLADFDRTITEAYPATDLLPYGTHPPLLRDGMLDRDWHCFVGYEDGRPVATAASYTGAHVNAVEMVSTRPECRGKGYGAAVTAAASLAAPDRPAALISSDLGYRVYVGLGYLTVTRWTLWVGTRQ
jgi:hypothetical protein